MAAKKLTNREELEALNGEGVTVTTAGISVELEEAGETYKFGVEDAGYYGSDKIVKVTMDCGEEKEFTPTEARALAFALLATADEAEG